MSETTSVFSEPYAQSMPGVRRALMQLTVTEAVGDINNTDGWSFWVPDYEWYDVDLMGDIFNKYLINTRASVSESQSMCTAWWNESMVNYCRQAWCAVRRDFQSYKTPRKVCPEQFSINHIWQGVSGRISKVTSPPSTLQWIPPAPKMSHPQSEDKNN